MALSTAGIQSLSRHATLLLSKHVASIRQTSIPASRGAMPVGMTRENEITFATSQSSMLAARGPCHSWHRLCGTTIMAGGRDGELSSTVTASSSSSSSSAASSFEVGTRAVSKKVGAVDSGSVPLDQLARCAEVAARKGADVVWEAIDKPRNIVYKGATDLVTDTDKKCEEAILAVLRETFPDHLLLGEEGGISGDSASEYLWCIDPLDGTTNFAHKYPCFAVSVAVLCRGRPVAACVVEFAGGPTCWVTRTFTASAGGGAFCNGQSISVSDTDTVEKSLLVTGFGYEHDEAWATNIELFKEFTDLSRGVRRLGAAAVDMCHVALGIVEAYWEFRLKPWDMAAGVLIVEEAGGRVTRMDGGDFTVFDRSVIVSNGKMHDKMLARIEPATKKLVAKGFDFSEWFKPAEYRTD